MLYCRYVLYLLPFWHLLKLSILMVWVIEHKVWLPVALLGTTLLCHRCIIIITGYIIQLQESYHHLSHHLVILVRISFVYNCPSPWQRREFNQYWRESKRESSRKLPGERHWLIVALQPPHGLNLFTAIILYLIFNDQAGMERYIIYHIYYMFIWMHSQCFA